MLSRLRGLGHREEGMCVLGMLWVVEFKRIGRL